MFLNCHRRNKWILNKREDQLCHLVIDLDLHLIVNNIYIINSLVMLSLYKQTILLCLDFIHSKAKPRTIRTFCSRLIVNSSKSVISFTAFSISELVMWLAFMDNT